MHSLCGSRNSPPNGRRIRINVFRYIFIVNLQYCRHRVGYRFNRNPTARWQIQSKKEGNMAIHLLPLAKLALMAGKAGTAKTTGAAMVKQAAAISARGQTPAWLVKGALAGLIGFKLLFLLVLAHKRNVLKSPTQVGCACTSCGRFINLNEISRGFSAKLTDREFVFTGKCPFCNAILSLPDSSMKSR